MILPQSSLTQMPHNDSLHSLGVNFNTATNPAMMVNMGANLGYPSIINNNIQGLSINYSNHIIQQAPTNLKIKKMISTPLTRLKPMHKPRRPPVLATKAITVIFWSRMIIVTTGSFSSNQEIFWAFILKIS